MGFSLSTEAAAAGFRLASYGTISSTSTEAMACLRAGEPGPLWVASLEQSAGRGRHGSVWQTPAGNLAASLALTLEAEPAIVATLGFVAGLALVRALDECCGAGDASFEARLRPAPQDEQRWGRPHPPHAEVRASASLEARAPFLLKWPNDVLAGGAKLAGILLETEQGGRARAVVIGIGVNVAHAPRGLPYPTTSLAMLGHRVSAERLFAYLSSSWLEMSVLWDEGRGFGSIRELWLGRAAGLGGPVSVRSAAGLAAGRFETVDEHGQLVLQVGDGSFRAVSAGEVHFGEAATAREEAAA